MSELLAVMENVLGDAVTVWLLFISLMFGGGLIGRLTGTFSQMRPVDLIGSLLLIGFIAVMAGARFSETGWYAVLIGLIIAVLMVAAFIVGAAFVPLRQVEVPVVHQKDLWNPAGGYYHGQDHHDLRSDCTNPVGNNVDTRA